MIKYNLYYNNEKVNKRPLSKVELDRVQNSNIINKYNNKTKEITTIPVNQIEVIECHVI